MEQIANSSLTDTVESLNLNGGLNENLVDTQPTENLAPINIVTEKKKKTSILSPALRAANTLNRLKKLGEKQIELPISKERLQVKALGSLSEVEAKTLIGNIRTYNLKNMQLFYECCQWETPKSFEEFLKYPRADFITILYGIIISTFSNLGQQRYLCPNETCPNPDKTKTFITRIQTKDLNIDFGKEQYQSHTGDYKTDNIIYDDEVLNIIYKFESMEELLNIFESKSNEEIRTNLTKWQMVVPNNELTPLYIWSLTIKDPDEDLVLTSPLDISIFLSKLDVTAKEQVEEINRKNIEFFTKFTPKISGHVNCPHCNTQVKEEDIDLMVEFFLKISTIY